MFSLRTSNPTPHLHLWEDYDAIIREALCRILGVSLSQQQWAQATLTVAVGGLGLRAASDHCQAAYITSLLASQELKQDIRGKSREECPPAVTAEVLEQLQVKTELHTERAQPCNRYGELPEIFNQHYKH